MPNRRSTGDRPRHNEATMRRFLKAMDESELTQSEFCERRGVPLSTATWWRRRLRESDEGASVAIARDEELIPVKILGSEMTCDVRPEAFEVRFPSGTLLRVPTHFDKNVLRTLVGVLGEQWLP